MQEPKARKDMDPRYLWDLSSIIESAAEFERQFKEAQAQVSAFSTWQGHVGENPRKAIREAMEMNRLLERLQVYAAMYADQDGGDSQAQDQLTRARSLAAKAESAVSFLQPELLSLPEQTLLDMKNDPNFSEYDVFVDDLLRNKPHTLSAKEERLLAMTNELMGAPDAVYTMLSDVDMPFPVVKDEEGNQVKLSNAMYGRLIRSRNREVRRGAFEAMMKGYNDYRQTYAATYRYSVKGDVVGARARDFDSVVEGSLAEVDKGVIEAAESMGSTTWQIIRKVLVPEAMPSLINGAALCMTTILAYTAMAGSAGGDGLGKIAITYGLNYREYDIMYVSSLLLVALVQIIQIGGDILMRAVDHRKK